MNMNCTLQSSRHTIYQTSQYDSTINFVKTNDPSQELKKKKLVITKIYSKATIYFAKFSSFLSLKQLFAKGGLFLGNCFFGPSNY